MTKSVLLFFTLFFAFFSGCAVQNNQSNQNTNPTKSDININVKSEPTKEVSVNIENGTPLPPKSETSDNKSCFNLKRDDLLLDKKQTFAIDFKPFEKSCFVTFHDPEFDNPPLGSQFFIYKDGKEIFNFPQQFGGGNTTCWVTAVDFEDLNGDQLKDIIVAGKCGGKADDYNENMVYLNNGKEFVTNANSNAETMDFSKISQIKDFVKKNPNLFSK